MIQIENGVYQPIEPELADGIITPNSVEDEDGIISIRTLPGGSKQLFFRFDKLKKNQDSAPSLEEIYENLRATLLEKTNFKLLEKQSEYLTAIVRLLESAYFGKQSLDSKSQELFEELSNELEILSEEEIAAAKNMELEEQDYIQGNDDVDQKEVDDTADKKSKISVEIPEILNLEGGQVKIINLNGMGVKIKTKIVKPVKEPSTTEINIDESHSYADVTDFEEPLSVKSTRNKESKLNENIQEENIYKKDSVHIDNVYIKESVTQKDANVVGINDNNNPVENDVKIKPDNNDISFEKLKQGVNEHLAEGIKNVLEKVENDPVSDNRIVIDHYKTGDKSDNSPGNPKQAVPKYEKPVHERTVRNLKSSDSRSVNSAQVKNDESTDRSDALGDNKENIKSSSDKVRETKRSP
jgi:hypothetical protein